MPGGLNPFGGSGGPSAPQPTGMNVSSPGYNVGTGVNSSGQVGTTLSTGGTFGQDAFQAQFPQMSTQLQNLQGQAGTAWQNYLNSIGYGTPNAQSPFLSPLASIENARTSALSNLQDSLARRGVMGSSFGSDQITQQDLAYNQLKASTQNSIAQSILSNNFAALQQQQSIIAQNEKLVTTALDKEFRDFAAANNLTTNMTDLTAGLSKFDQSLAAQQSAASGSFFGNALGLTNGGLGSLLGSGLGKIGSMFGGGGGAGGGIGGFDPFSSGSSPFETSGGGGFAAGPGGLFGGGGGAADAGAGFLGGLSNAPA